MTVYYFARSDVKGGCVFPINGMDMRRIVRTTAYPLLPSRDARTAASTICAPAVAHHQLGTSISATCRCICATHRCKGTPLKSGCGLHGFPGRIETHETQNTPFAHTHKTTFAKTSPKQRTPISRFMFNALNSNNALALVHGIQNDVRPDESPAIPQRRDDGIDRKRICERGRLKYPDKSLVRIEQSGAGLLATRAVLQIRKRFSHILHCRIRLHHGKHGYKPNSSRKRETPSRAG